MLDNELFGRDAHCDNTIGPIIVWERITAVKKTAVQRHGTNKWMALH
jgi:hypothetical protein